MSIENKTKKINKNILENTRNALVLKVNEQDNKSVALYIYNQVYE